MNHDAEMDSRETLIAERLRESRERLGLSQEDVAKAIKIPRPAVSAIENCKRRVSSTELMSLAKLYRCEISYFLDQSQKEAETDQVLFRTAASLSEEDKKKVLQFAQFLRNASSPMGERKD